ncbi:hypothetical protein GCK32_010491 [Trichostrongylus colubriformis]|uniref:Uncharacterized protein n=1 Tax=Trichostrongylus colubriformis TaxID=6319 RepID=A0AAN8FD69_TRICO
MNSPCDHLKEFHLYLWIAKYDRTKPMRCHNPGKVLPISLGQSRRQIQLTVRIHSDRSQEAASPSSLRNAVKPQPLHSTGEIPTR